MTAQVDFEQLSDKYEEMFGQRPGIPVFGPSDWGEYIENITKAIERGTPLTPEEFYGCEIEEGVYI